MLDSLTINIGLFVVAAFIIAVVGTRMTGIADRLADRTGLGEAMMGAVFLGGSTSLPGIVTSVTAAAQGYPELAISNAIGGIAAQTAFLAIALTILMTGTLLLGLLRREKYGIGNIGFESFLILLLYLGGFTLLFFGI